jgi:hypothetical protein
VTADAADRLQAALTDPDRTYTPEQVAYLMAAAARWAREDRDGEPDPLSYAAGHADGYRQRVAEENAGYPPPPYGVAETVQVADARRGRRAWDAAARAGRRRRGDHRGGAARVWPATWCGRCDADGQPVPHPPHVVEPDAKTGAEGFRCAGRTSRCPS